MRVFSENKSLVNPKKIGLWRELKFIGLGRTSGSWLGTDNTLVFGFQNIYVSKLEKLVKLILFYRLYIDELFNNLFKA